VDATVRLDGDRRRAPAHGAAQHERVTEQLIARGQPERIRERHRDPHEGAGEPGRLGAAQPLAGYQEVRADGDDERRRVDEEHGARGRGQDETLVDEDELGGEQRRDQRAVAERAVAAKERHAARSRPRPQQQRRAGRAEPRLEQRREAGVGELDGDLRGAPDRAEQDHERDGGEVEAGAHVGYASKPMAPLARSCAVLTLMLIAGAAPVPAADLEGKSGPLSWRISDVRQGTTTMDGVAHARDEFTLVVRNVPSRPLTLRSYAAAMSYAGIAASETTVSLDARLPPAWSTSSSSTRCCPVPTPLRRAASGSAPPG